MDSAIILKGTCFICNKCYGLALKVAQISRMYFKGIYIQIMLRISVLIDQMYGIEVALLHGDCWAVKSHTDTLSSTSTRLTGERVPALRRISCLDKRISRSCKYWR